MNLSRVLSDEVNYNLDLSKLNPTIIRRLVTALMVDCSYRHFRLQDLISQFCNLKIVTFGPDGYANVIAIKTIK